MPLNQTNICMYMCCCDNHLLETAKRLEIPLNTTNTLEMFKATQRHELVVSLFVLSVLLDHLGISKVASYPVRLC